MEFEKKLILLVSVETHLVSLACHLDQLPWLGANSKEIPRAAKQLPNPTKPRELPKWYTSGIYVDVYCPQVVLLSFHCASALNIFVKSVYFCTERQTMMVLFSKRFAEVISFYTKV